MDGADTGEVTGSLGAERLGSGGDLGGSQLEAEQRWGWKVRVQRGADDEARRLSGLFERFWKARNGREKGRLPGRQRWKEGSTQPRKVKVKQAER